MRGENLNLVLYYEAGTPAHSLALARIEQHPIFNNIARIAVEQAERRGDVETVRLAQVLELVLTCFRVPA